jgi:DNA polymerase-3 subunit delta'
MWPVIGQDKIVSLFKLGLQKKAVAHAYLLAGPHHVGKMTLALGLAQALNCEGSEPPCGECPSCQKILQLRHADVQVVDLNSGDTDKALTEISIDQIRQMEHQANLPPFEGKYKVFIINEAQQMSGEAANCLLKTLEEPVGRVVLIRITSNEN